MAQRSQHTGIDPGSALNDETYLSWDRWVSFFCLISEAPAHRF